MQTVAISKQDETEALSLQNIKPLPIQISSQLSKTTQPRSSSLAIRSLANRLSGLILLQVQQYGEAWYVFPTDKKRYYLGTAQDAYSLMRRLSLGVKHSFIKKYSLFPKSVLGKILLDIDDHGKAYYIYPKNKKAYYLGTPADAYTVMRMLGLGITDKDLTVIPAAEQ